MVLKTANDPSTEDPQGHSRDTQLTAAIEKYIRGKPEHRVATGWSYLVY